MTSVKLSPFRLYSLVKIQFSLIKKEDTNGRRGFNINLISLFMAEESYTMETIMEGWGAGFEVIEYTGTKFRKLDNLTYIVCHTEYDSQTQTVENTPFLVMHYTYHEEILLINTYSTPPSGIIM